MRVCASYYWLLIISNSVDSTKHAACFNRYLLINMKKNNNAATGLFDYFFVSLIVLTATGLLFKFVFYIYNANQFSSLSFSEVAYAVFWGLRFDLATAAMLTLLSCIVLWFFYRFLPKRTPAFVLLVIMLFVQISLQIGDTVYFVESGRHVSYEMRDVFTDASGLFMTAVSKHGRFIVLSYILAFFIIFIAMKFAKRLLSFFAGRMRLSKFKLKHELSLLVVLLLSVILVRGGITGLPQSVISVFKIGDAKLAALTMNGAYSVVYGAINSSKEISQLPVKLPADIDVNKVMRALYPGKAESAVSKKVQPYNLIFILLEGWPADRMDGYGFDKPVTPFFTSLMQKSLLPLGVISGGVRTTEGIYAIFCSQQNPLGKTVAQTSLQNNQYRCLPEILKQQGWSTAFFQGTHKETSGTGAFAQAVGFTRSYAKEDMPEGRYTHNYWGAHDPDVYDFALDRIKEMPRPFLVGINTNSTHDLHIPAGVQAIFGDKNNELKYQSVLHFADQSLKEFFDKVKQTSFYNNTIFVILADHTGGKHKTTAAKYFIPGLVFAEDIVAAKKINHYVSQRDFSPTVLEMLGLPAAGSFAGKSFLPASGQQMKSNKNVYFADYFDAGTIGWLSKDLMVETNIINPSEIKCYTIARGLLNAELSECNDQHKTQSINALVFTSYSQNLLFSGKTKSFLNFKQ